MRAVLQRVVSARVEVEGRIVSQIGPGLLVLVGVLESDTDVDAEYMCRKILNTKIFTNDDSGKAWDQNVMQKGYEVLLVSQFTLYGQLKGNKLDFHVAMPPERAKPFYESFVARVAKAYEDDRVKDGVFGAMMQVHLVNDGPVTIQLESRKKTSMQLDQRCNGIVGDRERCHARVGLPCSRLKLGPTWTSRAFIGRGSGRASTTTTTEAHPVGNMVDLSRMLRIPVGPFTRISVRCMVPCTIW
ncbi:D-aminoacyl-tRNA deacylase [Marchantia polymorpha subsp. ruderalis]